VGDPFKLLNSNLRRVLITLGSRYPNRSGVSLSKLVEIKFVWIANHLGGSQYQNNSYTEITYLYSLYLTVRTHV